MSTYAHGLWDCVWAGVGTDMRADMFMHTYAAFPGSIRAA